MEKLLKGGEVEWKALREVVNINNGKDWKKLSVGNIPVYGSGGVMAYVDKFAYNKPTVLIPRKGSITNIFYVEEPIWNVDTIYYTEIDINQLIPKFFYYYMKTIDLMKFDTGSGRPSLTQAILYEIPIPIPPLKVQEEIVRILDAFTVLTEELTAELTARKKQYEYYRDKLFTFEEGEIEWKALGELAENLDSMRKPITSSVREFGDIPYYGASGIVDYVKDYIFEGDFLLVSEDGANLLARNTPIAFSANGKMWVNNHAHVLKFKTYEERRFVEFYLNHIDLTPYISGAAQPKLNQKKLNSIMVPNPLPLQKKRIVSILDKFDALISSNTEGLLREIELRQKQYKYYSNILLSFPNEEVEA